MLKQSYLYKYSLSLSKGSTLQTRVPTIDPITVLGKKATIKKNQVAPADPSM